MTTTTRLGMTHIESTDSLVGSPGVGVMGKFNDAIEKIDDATGAVVCTSSTNPSSPYAGMWIYETDTYRTKVRNASNSAWVSTGGIPIVNTTNDVTAPYNGQMVFALADGTLYRYQSSNTTWYRYPDIQRKYKAATESVTSSTTLQNDDIFLWSVLANSAYTLEGYICFDGAQATASPTSTGGLKSAFTGPAGASMFWTNFGGATEFSADLVTHNMVAQGLTSTRNVATQVTATATMTMAPKGILVVGGTAGTLQFQWAQAASSGTATRILGGSWMRLEKVA